MNGTHLILSIHRSTYTTPVWWGPDGRGYTTDIAQAGRYSEDEARRLAARGRGDTSRVVAWADIVRLGAQAAALSGGA